MGTEQGLTFDPFLGLSRWRAWEFPHRWEQPAAHKYGGCKRVFAQDAKNGKSSQLAAIVIDSMGIPLARARRSMAGIRLGFVP
jgi:hypothetical protein